jgi:hypothetical protein
MRAKFVHCVGTTTMDEEHTTLNETNATSGVSLFDPSFTPQRFLALIKLWKRLPLIEAIVQFASIPAALAVFGLPRSGGDVVILILAILLWCYVVHLSRNIFYIPTFCTPSAASPIAGDLWKGLPRTN